MATMTKEQLAKILKGYVEIYQKANALDELMDGDAFTEYLGDDLAILDTILDICGVPKDTTVEEGSENGTCRDYWYEQTFDFEDNPEEMPLDFYINVIDEWMKDGEKYGGAK
jgi:hypothetical protein